MHSGCLPALFPPLHLLAASFFLLMLLPNHILVWMQQEKRSGAACAPIPASGGGIKRTAKAKKGARNKK